MLNSILGSTLTLSGFLICTAVSLVLGLATAGVADRRAPEKAMAAAAITAAGLSVLVNIFFYYSGIECRARESIQGLCDALCRHSYVKLRQTIKEKGVDECGELWPSG